MQFIPLTNGGEAVVDDDDLPSLQRIRWFRVDKRRTSYARGYDSTTKRMVLMHRLIIQPADGVLIDHINRDGLDNRRANLRQADRCQNAQNRKADRGRRFKGVYAKGSRWQARIGRNGRSRLIGSFVTPEDAARAYDLEARRQFGEFACLNAPSANL